MNKEKVIDEMKILFECHSLFCIHFVIIKTLNDGSGAKSQLQVPVSQKKYFKNIKLTLM